MTTLNSCTKISNKIISGQKNLLKKKQIEKELLKKVVLSVDLHAVKKKKKLFTRKYKRTHTI